MMKFLFRFSLLLLLVLSCNTRGGKKPSPAPAQPESVPSTAVEKAPVDTIPESIALCHEWKELGDSVYLHRVPKGTEIRRWEQTFERVFDEDSASGDVVVLCYTDVNRYIAVRDLLEALEKKQLGVDMFEWRLLQWDPMLGSMPLTGFSRVAHIRDQISRLLDYEPPCNADGGNQASLLSKCTEYYVQVLRREIRKRVRPEVREALRVEAAAARRVHTLEDDSFYKIRSETYSGSSFGSQMGLNSALCFDMEARSCELFLKSLMGAYVSSDMPHIITKAQVLKEYDSFSSSLYEVDEKLPRKVRKAALAREKQAWKEWMDARQAVSSLLTGKAKMAFDEATWGIQREKLIQLKNRYYSNEWFPGNRDEYLDSDSSDEEILSHEVGVLWAN